MRIGNGHMNKGGGSAPGDPRLVVWFLCGVQSFARCHFPNCKAFLRCGVQIYAFQYRYRVRSGKRFLKPLGVE